LLGLDQVAGHGFLHQDVLTAYQGGNSDGHKVFVGRGDNDDFYIVSGDNLSPVSSSQAAHFCCQARGVGFINICYNDQFVSWRLAHYIGPLLTDEATANDTDFHGGESRIENQELRIKVLGCDVRR
jgi:hypothetical protein